MVDVVYFERGTAEIFKLFDASNENVVYSEQSSGSYRIDYVNGGRARTAILSGYGFEYFPPDHPQAGAPSAGTVTSVSDSLEGAIQIRIEKLSLPVSTIYEYLQWNDPARVAADILKNADTITGSAYDDDLDAGAGADILRGGLGHDTYIVRSTKDQVIEAIDEGTDHVLSLLNYTLRANVENLTLLGTAALTGTGNDLDNIIVGNDGANILSGGSGNDTLSGGAGNDTLIGGSGADTLSGGDGLDTASYTGSAAGVDVDLRRVAQSGGEAEGDGLSGIENVQGSASADTLTGDAGANVLLGLAGDDRLSGKGGADRLQGGLGNDTYVIDTIDLPNVVENAGQGIDTIEAHVSYGLRANVENIVLAGPGDLRATGNELANVITGNDGVNLLVGKAGDDTIYGGGGNDQLNGDEGRDSLYGGSGNDRLLGGARDDVLSGEAGSDRLEGGEGVDILSGGLDADTLVGGIGADTFLFRSHADSTRSAADTIADFVRGEDVITLAFDPDAGTADTAESFSFIGTGAFTGAFGEVRVVQSGRNTIVEVNTDADGPVDFQILLTRVTAADLGASDFGLLVP